MNFDRQLRVNKLRALLQAKDIPALIVTNRENVFYLSGFSGSAGALIITDNEMLLVTDCRYYLQVADEAPACELVCVEKEQPTEEQAIRNALHSIGVASAAFEAANVSYQQYLALQGDGNANKFTLQPAQGLVEQLRLIKDEGEAELMRVAARITDGAFIHLLSYVSIGVTERELALEAEWYMRRHGAEDVAFASIVAAGPRSALPHATPGDRPLQVGDLVVVDMGASHQHYCADMTRTFAVAESRPQAARIYAVCAQAQQAVENFLHSGMTGIAADKIARDIIEKAGYGEFFGHGTGHGVGLEVHEAPRLSTRGENALPAGAMVTVEPGIYLPGVGGVRIEDLVMIKETGVEVLTHAPKLMELPIFG